MSPVASGEDVDKLRSWTDVANHTHRHCIANASCEGRGLEDLARAAPGELQQEIEDAHHILQAAVAKSGFDVDRVILPFFRAPGSQQGRSRGWRAAEVVSRARVPAMFGTIGWDIPRDVHDHALCWRRGMSGEACAQAYSRHIDRLGMDRGVILVHDNMPEAPSMVRPLIAGLRKRGGRIAHPRCIIGCTR